MKGKERAGVKCLSRRAQIGRGLVILAVVLGLEMMGAHFGTRAAPGSAPLRQTIPTRTPTKSVATAPA